jgi:hypothetical protein
MYKNCIVNDLRSLPNTQERITPFSRPLATSAAAATRKRISPYIATEHTAETRSGSHTGGARAGHARGVGLYLITTEFQVRNLRIELTVHCITYGVIVLGRAKLINWTG